MRMEPCNSYSVTDLRPSLSTPDCVAVRVPRSPALRWRSWGSCSSLTGLESVARSSDSVSRRIAIVNLCNVFIFACLQKQ